jgi:hypothetical protein
MGPAERVYGGQYDAPMMDTAQTGYNPELQRYQMGPAERVTTQDYTGQNVEQYMNPFMQNVVDKQTREAERQAGLAAKQERAQSIQRGSFGGGRTAVREAAAARDLAQLKSDIYGTGQQAAFQNAQQQFNTQQQRQLAAQQANQQAGLTVGGQNLAANLGVQQLGTQTGLQTAMANLSAQQQANVQNQAAKLQAQGLTAGQAMQAALANQQAGLTTGQQNLAAQLGVQQLGSGQNMQAQLANQQAYQDMLRQREASRQFGYGQQMTAAQARAQYGLAGQQLGEQSRQYGAGYGLQGLGTALQGAGQLGNLGQQEFGQQKDIYGLQNQFGGQRQALEQQILSQQYQDFLNQRKNPYQQLDFLTGALQGIPMGTVQSMYQAAPTGLQTLGSLGLGAYGAKQLGMFAKGGSVTSDDFVEGTLDRLSTAQLNQSEQIAKANGDQARLQQIAEEKATRASESRGLAGMYNQLPQGVQARMAGGGIVAFAGDDDENDGSQLVRGDSAADTINAALEQSPGNQDMYARSISDLLGYARAMGEYKPEGLTQEQLDEIIKKRFALEQKLAGPNPNADIKRYMAEAQADRPQALQQAKGLAALKAMSALVQPGGFIRGLAGAGGAAGDTMEKAFQADRAEKRALASMQFNLADAERKERMGMTRSAMDAASQAQKDKREAGKAHMQTLNYQAQAAGKAAMAAKPTGQRGASEPKAAEQYGKALLEYKRNPTPENLQAVEAWKTAVQESKTSDIGDARLAAIMAGVAGQRSDTQVRADVAREGQERQIADKVLEARTKAQYSPAYIAAKTPADKAAVLKKAEDEARAVYKPATTPAKRNVIKLD